MHSSRGCYLFHLTDFVQVRSYPNVHRWSASKRQSCPVRRLPSSSTRPASAPVRALGARASANILRTSSSSLPTGADGLHSSSVLHRVAPAGLGASIDHALWARIDQDQLALLVERLRRSGELARKKQICLEVDDPSSLRCRSTRHTRRATSPSQQRECSDSRPPIWDHRHAAVARLTVQPAEKPLS